MGGRGGSSGIKDSFPSVSEAFGKYNSGANKDGWTDRARAYSPYMKGFYSKYEAGVIYRAVKEGKLNVKPETTQTLYKDAEHFDWISNRDAYQQNWSSYENMYSAVRAVLNNDYKSAQVLITDWENDKIKYSTPKSKWYKYKKD